MGNYINFDIPNTETSWNYVIIERSVLQSASYSELTSQVITNNTFYDETGTSTHWYKMRFYDSGSAVYSDYTNPFQAEDEYYCTAREVASFIGVTSYTDTTNPTRFEVEDIIADVCDSIDKITHHAWRKVRVTNEYYNIRIQDRLWEYRGAYPYDYSTRISVALKHRSIRAFVSGTTKIEVWDGSNWTDFVTTYTEGRNQDWWADYERGILYFVSRYPLWQKANARITYDYGEIICPGDIKRAAIMMSSSQILAKQDLNVVYPQNTMGTVLNTSERWEKWNEMAMKLLERRIEILGMRYY